MIFLSHFMPVCNNYVLQICKDQARVNLYYTLCVIQYVTDNKTSLHENMIKLILLTLD